MNKIGTFMNMPWADKKMILRKFFFDANLKKRIWTYREW